MEDKIPQGIVAILTGNDGREIASTTDFHTGSPGGFTQKEAQNIRARESLAMEVMRKLSSPLLSNSINQYNASIIMDQMCRDGCRVILVPVGYDD